MRYINLQQIFVGVSPEVGQGICHVILFKQLYLQEDMVLALRTHQDVVPQGFQEFFW